MRLSIIHVHGVSAGHKRGHSDELRNRTIRSLFGRNGNWPALGVEWREAMWAHQIDKRQARYFEILKGEKRWDAAQMLMVQLAGDALAWGGARGPLLAEIRKEIALSKGTHVALIGHSLGGLLAFEAALKWPERMAHIIALGSPLALPWIASEPPIPRLPLAARPQAITEVYDVDDPIACPISVRMWPRAQRAVERVEVNVGWSPACHDNYQTEEVARICAERLHSLYR